jgi:hypothetical protein
MPDEDRNTFERVRSEYVKIKSKWDAILAETNSLSKSNDDPWENQRSV